MKSIAQDTITNGSAVPPMDSSSLQKGIWIERFKENQIYLKANVMAIQLAFIGLPLILGLMAAAIMILVPTPVGRMAGLIVGTTIFPGLGICWWIGKMSQPSHFIVYKGTILEQGTEQLFQHERPTLTINVETHHHLSANGLHLIPSDKDTVQISTSQEISPSDDNQTTYFVCLTSNELIQHYPKDS